MPGFGTMKTEIMFTNPGKNCLVGVESIHGFYYFKRFYVGFKAFIDGWNRGYERIIGLDGSFLNEQINGFILTVIRRDADNHVYPITWEVVNVENEDNCTWFINDLVADLDLVVGNGLVVISNQHKILTIYISIHLLKLAPANYGCSLEYHVFMVKLQSTSSTHIQFISFLPTSIRTIRMIPGRHKVKKVKRASESQDAKYPSQRLKVPWTIRCGNCQESWHNKFSCTNREVPMPPVPKRKIGRPRKDGGGQPIFDQFHPLRSVIPRRDGAPFVYECGGQEDAPAIFKSSVQDGAPLGSQSGSLVVTPMKRSNMMATRGEKAKVSEPSHKPKNKSHVKQPMSQEVRMRP
ncbi:unnamed protein product [Lactuca saligna]|uniref:Uncharacterized protein n=1 Tax=Lactuca saligna TaxID=75948 RepID=A0AA36EPE3_LACSI|nr:unnamed protein product [Lactuca saligna]